MAESNYHRADHQHPITSPDELGRLIGGPPTLRNLQYITKRMGIGWVEMWPGSISFEYPRFHVTGPTHRPNHVYGFTTYRHRQERTNADDRKVAAAMKELATFRRCGPVCVECLSHLFPLATPGKLASLQIILRHNSQLIRDGWASMTAANDMSSAAWGILADAAGEQIGESSMHIIQEFAAMIPDHVNAESQS